MIFPFLFGIFVAKMCDATGFGLILGCALDIIGLHWIWIWIGFHWIWMEKNGQKEKWIDLGTSSPIGLGENLFWRIGMVPALLGGSCSRSSFWPFHSLRELGFLLISGRGRGNHLLLISTVSLFARMVRKMEIRRTLRRSGATETRVSCHLSKEAGHFEGRRAIGGEDCFRTFDLTGLQDSSPATD